MTIPRIDQPREGYYRTRLVRGGIFVGVRFFLDGDGLMRVEVDGRTHRIEAGADGIEHIVPLDPLEIWPWVCGQQITEREFHFLARRRAWAQQHAPDHPAAQPHQPIDLTKLPPRF